MSVLAMPGLMVARMHHDVVEAWYPICHANGRLGVDDTWGPANP